MFGNQYVWRMLRKYLLHTEEHIIQTNKDLKMYYEVARLIVRERYMKWIQTMVRDGIRLPTTNVNPSEPSGEEVTS